MTLTIGQQTKIDEFKEALKSQISEYSTWGGQRHLNVIYFQHEGIIHLKAIVPNGISNDNAGMYVEQYYFKILENGELKNSQEHEFNSKREITDEVIICNPQVI
jgi:hypothetical protein